MDMNKMSLFASLKKRMDYINSRQEVLAQNIANADTPKYRAKDLVPYDFKDLLRRENMHVKMTGSNAKHINTAPPTMTDYAKDRSKPYETTLDGNQVVLEEQIMKMNESRVDHELTTQLYKKNLALFRTAIGRR